MNDVTIHRGGEIWSMSPFGWEALLRMNSRIKEERALNDQGKESEDERAHDKYAALQPWRWKQSPLMGCRRRAGADAGTVDVVFVLAALQIPRLHLYIFSVLCTLLKETSWAAQLPSFIRPRGNWRSSAQWLGKFLFIQMASPCRHFGDDGCSFRPLTNIYFLGGITWSSAPRPFWTACSLFKTSLYFLIKKKSWRVR